MGSGFVERCCSYTAYSRAQLNFLRQGFTKQPIQGYQGVRYLRKYRISLFDVQLHVTTKLTYLMTAYYTPANS